MEILQAGGMRPLDILRMGTHYAAKMIGRLNALGTLEVGKLADMVLLAADPTEDTANALAIERVFIAGRERLPPIPSSELVAPKSARASNDPTARTTHGSLALHRRTYELRPARKPT